MNISQYYSSGPDPDFSPTNEYFLEEEKRLREHLDRRRKLRDSQRAASPAVRKSQKPRRRAKTTPAIRWLRKLTCPLVYGERTPDGIYPSTKRETLIGCWDRKYLLPRLANYDYADHFGSVKTFYFFGNGRVSADYTLVMIDIDVQKCHSQGSPQGAWDFADHLKRTYWPELYFERSTNGKGVHGYFLLDKRGVGSKAANASLKRLEAWLRGEMKRINADIELVEIKGMCPEISFQNGDASAIKYGTFAKLPREDHRFAEWEATTILNWHELRSAKYDPPKKPEPLVNQEIASSRILKIKNPTCGSVSGKSISEEDLAAIPHYERMYRQWTEGKNLKAGKWSVTDHDFAVGMVLLGWFRKNSNKDESLPCRRVAQLWQGLFDAGDISRPWNHHRWKVIRDFLSKRGHIDWSENRYEYGTHQGGKFQAGVACKWQITQEFATHLQIVGSSTKLTISRGEASFVDTAFEKLIPNPGNGRYLVPERYPIRAEMERTFWYSAYEACESLFAA